MALTYRHDPVLATQAAKIDAAIEKEVARGFGAALQEVCANLGADFRRQGLRGTVSLSSDSSTFTITADSDDEGVIVPLSKLKTNSDDLFSFKGFIDNTYRNFEKFKCPLKVCVRLNGEQIYSLG